MVGLGVGVCGRRAKCVPGAVAAVRRVGHSSGEQYAGPWSADWTHWEEFLGRLEDPDPAFLQNRDRLQSATEPQPPAPTAAPIPRLQVGTPNSSTRRPRYLPFQSGPPATGEESAERKMQKMQNSHELGREFTCKFFPKQLLQGLRRYLLSC